MSEETEEWRDISNFEGHKISSFGRVMSFRKKRWVIRHQGTSAPGYKYVTLNGVVCFVHRLVLETFVGPCPEGMEARHVKTNDPGNNHLENLEWGTPKQNGEDRKRHREEGLPPIENSKYRQTYIPKALANELEVYAKADDRTLHFAVKKACEKYLQALRNGTQSPHLER